MNAVYGGVYETPGGTILRAAHMAIESITLESVLCQTVSLALLIFLVTSLLQYNPIPFPGTTV